MQFGYLQTMLDHPAKVPQLYLTLLLNCPLAHCAQLIYSYQQLQSLERSQDVFIQCSLFFTASESSTAPDDFQNDFDELIDYSESEPSIDYFDEFEEAKNVRSKFNNQQCSIFTHLQSKLLFHRISPIQFCKCQLLKHYFILLVQFRITHICNRL